MMAKLNRFAVAVAAIFAPFAFVVLVSPAVSQAVECGQGTVFDPVSNTCVAAPLPPPPPPPPPAWNGDITPYFSVGICAPVPFVAVCAGI